jgi:hypothetical protein
MSYLKKQRKKQYNKGVKKVDRRLEEIRETEFIPPNPVDDPDSEIAEAIKNIDSRRSDLEIRVP